VFTGVRIQDKRLFLAIKPNNYREMPFCFALALVRAGSLVIA
jgi:hypothetical protein